MIPSIQSNALETVNSMEKNCETVSNLVLTTSHTKHSIDTINNIFTSVKELIFEISSALDEQKNASHHVSSNVESVTHSAQENASNINNVTHLVDELAEVSRSLKQSVSGFEL